MRSNRINILVSIISIIYREPQFNTGSWSKEEHFKLLSALKSFGKDYKRLEQEVGTRSFVQI